jgi:sarcosine oxidase gamma subunit
MSRRDAAWLAEPVPERRFGVKGPRAAAALKQLGLSIPARANNWAPLRMSERDDSWNVIGRLGSTEFFIEECAPAPGIAALEILAGDFAGAYPVLREDFALVLGGPRANEVLAQVCNVNLTAPPGPRTLVMTLMIGVSVLVLPQVSDADGPVYRIWCDPGFGTYLWTELEQIVQKIPIGRA